MDDAGWMLLASFANLVFRPPGDRNDVTDEQGDELRKGFSCKPMLKNMVLLYTVLYTVQTLYFI